MVGIHTNGFADGRTATGSASVNTNSATQSKGKGLLCNLSEILGYHLNFLFQACA